MADKLVDLFAGASDDSGSDFDEHKAAAEEQEQAVDEHQNASDKEQEGGAEEEGQEAEEAAQEKDDNAEQEDEENEEEGEESDEEQVVTKKRKKRRQLVLEEEDYELLEENLGIRHARPEHHRRIKKARDIAGEDAEQQRTAAEQLQAELFGVENDDLEDDIEEPAQLNRERDEGADNVRPSSAAGAGIDAATAGTAAERYRNNDELFDEDEEDEDDWIVHEYDDDDQAGGDGRRRPRRRRNNLEGQLGLDEGAVEEAHEIFGDASDLLAMYAARKAAGGGLSQEYLDADMDEDFFGEESEEDGDGAEEGGEEEYEDEDGNIVTRPVSRRRRSQMKGGRTRRDATLGGLASQVEPSTLAAMHMTDRDEAIRQLDLPEREQLTRGRDPEVFDLQVCADWIWEQLMGGYQSSSTSYSNCSKLLEVGAREVDGLPPAWMSSGAGDDQQQGAYASSGLWPKGSLRGEIEDTRTERAFYLGRKTEHEKQDWRNNNQAQEALKSSIQAALAHIYENHEEIPVVAMYRKELLGELLAVRYKDEPRYKQNLNGTDIIGTGALDASNRAIRKWDVLYAVQDLSNRWRALQRIREARLAAYAAVLEAAEAKQIQSSQQQQQGMFGEEEADVEAGATLTVGGLTEQDRAELDRCTQLVQAASTIDAIDDCDVLFKRWKLHRHGANGGDASDQLLDLTLDDTLTAAIDGVKKPKRTTEDQFLAQTNLLDFAREFCLSGGQLSDNILANYKLHEPLNPESSPELLAENYVNVAKQIDSAEVVLRNVIKAAAREIAAEPAVREMVRRTYWDNAELNTTPTDSGDAVLDAFHALGIAKRLRAKPLRTFAGTDTFMRVKSAAEAGFINVSIGLTWDAHGKMVDVLSDLFVSASTETHVAPWNALRREIARYAFNELLLPDLKRQATSRLTQEAKIEVLQQAGDKLWEYATQAPLKLLVADEEETEYVAEPRLLVACYGPGNPASTFVMLDAQGNMVDYLHCPQLSGMLSRRNITQGVAYNILNDVKRRDDAERLQKFILDHLPDAIVVGIAHPEALVLQEGIARICQNLQDEHIRVIQSLPTKAINTYMVDESLAALWENSAAAREELPNSAGIVRRAVALGRQMLDPIAQLTTLSGSGERSEIMALNLHPLQDYLVRKDKTVFEPIVHQTLTSAVAQIGVDINEAAKSNWKAAPLNFVPGLGPRKAKALLRAIAQAGGYVEDRMQLLQVAGRPSSSQGRRRDGMGDDDADEEEDANGFDGANSGGVLGPIVARNCAPYLRIRPSVAAVQNADLNPLDDTRVHIEHYPYAQAIAMSAFQGEDPVVALENSFTSTQDISALDLKIYDDHLKNEGLLGPAGTIISTLIDIQMEFVSPYGDMRKPFEPLKTADVFWLAAGEGPLALKPGRRVEAVVRYAGDSETKCTLPDFNNIVATLSLEDSVDSSDAAQLDKKMGNYLKSGQSISCRIKKIQPDQDPAVKLMFVPAGKLDDQQDSQCEFEYLLGIEPYYHVLSELEKQAIKQERFKKLKNATEKLTTKQRNITHSNYKDMTQQDAAEQLRSMGEIGEFVLRPRKTKAGTAPKDLCATMLAAGGDVYVIDIVELGHRKSDLSLAPPLQVHYVSSRPPEVYDELEELMAMGLKPVAENWKKLKDHRKWYDHGEAQVQAFLKQQKQANPQSGVYCFAPVSEGDFVGQGFTWLAFIVTNNVHKEAFSVTPDGYYFRKKMYPTLDAMTNAWKKDPYGQKAKAEEQRKQQGQQFR